MTFDEVTLYLKELNEKEKDDYKMMLSLIWKNALWSRTDAKKFPNLEEILKEVDQQNEKVKTSKKNYTQTPEQMFEVVKMLNQKFGGV